MITSKERAILKRIAHPLKPICQIGKNAITKELLNQIEDHLFHQELIKIKVLQNCPLTAKEIISQLSKPLSCEEVSAIGGIVTLYKFSAKKDIVHVEIK